MIGKQRVKHRSRHARKLLDYAIISGDLADTYFAIHAYLTAENRCDAWQARQREITERKASRKCVSCNRRFSFDDSNEHCRKHWTQCTRCAWTP